MNTDKMEKQNYEAPKVEVIRFEEEDIITTSAVQLPEDNFGS